ncbi:MAG TPA: hypothetical protein VGO46_09580 [Gemmatimonadaceae bacterium]|nr:hypothetical protein [Gemmatimonadaceae bacterium]
MAKFSLAVAALVAVSLAGARVQAQAEQLASEQSAIVQETQMQGSTDEVQVATLADVQIADVQSTEVQTVEAPAPVPEIRGADVQLVDAQATSPDAPVATTLAVATGPSMDASALSPRLTSDAALSTQAMRRPSRGSGVGLMIFGGAALITGLIIGDDAGTVIAVGGALVGLYGLYVYLGRPTGMGHGDAAHSQRIGLGYKLNTN